MNVRRHLPAAAALSLLLLPVPAHADGFFSPFVGVTANSATDLSEKANKLNFGATLGWMGGGIIGVSVDAGFTPNFFGDSPDFGDSNVTTLMGNLILGAPIGGQHGGGVRPYVSGGAGLIKTRIDDLADLTDVSRSDLGINVGGGVMGFFSDRIGLRGDIRYFRALEDVTITGPVNVDLGSFKFWRGTVGLVVRF